ncbi:MAG: YdiU family protein [Myxococcales bacterium]|nr:YdiU family protein [Myxococcales bacterium]
MISNLQPLVPVRLCTVHEPAWLTLGHGFADPVEPAKFPKAHLRFRHQRCAARVGLDTLTDDQWQASFHRFEPLDNNLPRPLALRYHGHQFRNYNPELGDGRGFLFAQLRDLEDGRLLDLATKGSGTTPYSRGGDGRLTLKGGVREVLAASLLEALGVYTSKPFSLYETGESLHRSDEPSPTRGSILVRLGHSHLRFGTFQRYAYSQDRLRLERLVDYANTYLLPLSTDTVGLDEVPAGRTPADIMYRRVVLNSARLVSQWMVAGFVHGVLNTDNMVVTGESFDYGPWRFLSRYDPHFTAAYFDHSGLYAYGRQSDAVLWNLQRLAEALDDCLEAPIASVLESYSKHVARCFVYDMAERLGVMSPTGAFSLLAELCAAAWAFLQTATVPFDQFFFDWWGGEISEKRALDGPYAHAYSGPAFGTFRAALGAVEPASPERLVSPYFSRTHPEGLLYDEVEALWAPIAQDDDWGGFEAKLAGIEARRIVERGSHDEWLAYKGSNNM